MIALVLAAAVYSVPSPLPAGAPGAVIWSKPFAGASALKSAASDTLVLYHTRSLTGKDVAVSGVISLPKGTAPSGGWPAISWAHGTTGNAPQCAPSQLPLENLEQRFLEGFVSAGYAVVQTDYEGEATPGLHPYLASTAAARDVTDIVRAARQIDPTIGKRWFALGHSEGGAAALFAGAIGPAWAPELQLGGVVAFAPAAGMTDSAGHVMLSQQSTPMLPLIAMALEGIASTDPALDLHSIFSPQGLALLPSLQERCLGALMIAPQWRTAIPAQLFQPNAFSDRLLQDFEANEPQNLKITVPVLIEQGTNDLLVPYSLSDGVSSALRANGASVQFDAVAGASHDSVLRQSFDRVLAWIRGR